MIKIEKLHRTRIAAASLCDPATVERAYSGKPVRYATLLRITDAARRLKLPTPPGAPDEEQQPPRAA
jgi:hypothetical protein